MKLNPHDLPAHIKALNPHLWPTAPVAGLPAAEPEPAAALPLERPASRAAAGEPGPHYRVALVVFRHRLLDGDNLVGGLKPLRDEVARLLGVDDADQFIAWEYAQVPTRGRSGVALKIEALS
ncbi:MAG: hypothetical protein H7A46_19405 [Verrucomicrobiales bacterium]|nr:hypothetical protein [Verrucomicrobiales bacterium]